jgi:hypothetical protein
MLAFDAQQVAFSAAFSAAAASASAFSAASRAAASANSRTASFALAAASAWSEALSAEALSASALSAAAAAALSAASSWTAASLAFSAAAPPPLIAASSIQGRPRAAFSLARAAASISSGEVFASRAFSLSSSVYSFDFAALGGGGAPRSPKLSLLSRVYSPADDPAGGGGAARSPVGSDGRDSFGAGLDGQRRWDRNRNRQLWMGARAQAMRAASLRHPCGEGSHLEAWGLTPSQQVGRGRRDRASAVQRTR